MTSLFTRIAGGKPFFGKQKQEMKQEKQEGGKKKIPSIAGTGYNNHECMGARLSNSPLNYLFFKTILAGDFLGSPACSPTLFIPWLK
jgi:hypothetical protein